MLHELFAQIADDDFARAGLKGFLLYRLKIFALSEVSAKGDHLTAVLLF